MTTDILATAHTDVTAHLSADGIVHRNTLWALGAVLVPVPGADVLALTAVQVKMMGELSRLYDVKFDESLARKLVLSLLSSLGGFAAGAVVALSLIKLLPGAGTLLGLASFQVFAGAFTFATGRVYTMHIESGGTLLNFDPRVMRRHFQREFAAGKQAAANPAMTTIVSQPAPAVAPGVTLPDAAAPLEVGPAISGVAAPIEPPPFGVVIERIHYKGSVKRTQADEYAELMNHGEQEVDVSGWMLDAGGSRQVFTFPAGTRLVPGQVVRVYTDEVHPETGGFKFGVRRAIWNDHGDRACLRDAAGTIVSEFTYGGLKL